MRKGSSGARCGRAGGGDDQMRCVPKDLLRAARTRLLLLAGVGMLTLLAACGQENRFIAPPPPKVTVQLPLQQTVTPYLEATGNAASVNTVKLLARVQGYVQEIKYQDGATVKKGTPLFVIEPEPYKVQLEQAQAAEEGAKATLINAEAEFTRQQELQSKDVSTQAALDKARANRDTARANVLQAQANVQTAEINLGYTTVSAPFDGVVNARPRTVGELVGGDHTSELATHRPARPDLGMVQSERTGRAARPGPIDAAGREHRRPDQQGPGRGRPANRGRISAQRLARLRFPRRQPVDRHAAGTCHLRERQAGLAAGLFRSRASAVACAAGAARPRVAVGADQAGRYVLVVNADGIVEQRRVQLGQTTADMRVIASGLKPDERVIVAGILDAVPGQKVDPQLQAPKSAAAEPAGPQ